LSNTHPRLKWLATESDLKEDDLPGDPMEKTYHKYLHVACCSNKPLSVIQALIQAWPAALQAPTGNHLPLHEVWSLPFIGWNHTTRWTIGIRSCHHLLAIYKGDTIFTADKIDHLFERYTPKIEMIGNWIWSQERWPSWWSHGKNMT